MTDIPRIFSPPIPNATALAAPQGAPTPKIAVQASDPSYLAKLMTMFPAEAVTFYTLGSKAPINPLFIALVVFFALIAVRWAAFRSSTTNKSNGSAIIVSAVSFIMWVFASADLRLILNFSEHATKEDVEACQNIAAFLIAVWTWVVPNFIRLDPA